MNKCTSDIDSYRSTLFANFPELFDGMDGYRLKVAISSGSDSKHDFEFINGIYEDDTPSYHYKFDLSKGRFSLIYNFTHIVEAKSYNELVEKRGAIIEGRMQFVRIPEFQCVFYLDRYGIGFAANGANGFFSAAHSPKSDIDDYVRFMIRYFFDAREDYCFVRDYYDGGYQQHERWVELSALKKEYTNLRKKKANRMEKHQLREHEFEIHIEESKDYDFHLRCSWPDKTEEKTLSLDISKDEMKSIFRNMLSEYLD